MGAHVKAGPAEFNSSADWSARATSLPDDEWLPEQGVLDSSGRLELVGVMTVRVEVR